MFTEPRHRRRAVTLAAISLALLIALPVALQRPQAASEPLSTSGVSADALEQRSRLSRDVDLWVGMEQAAALYENEKREYIVWAVAEQERVRREAEAAAAAAAKRERQRRAAAEAAEAAKRQQAAAPSRKAAPSAAPAAGGSGVWDRLAQCESHGNWSINTGNGYYGGLQMDTTFWDAYGNPAYGQAHQAPKGEQIAAATKARDSGRGYYPWPTCAKKLGLI